MKSFTISAVLSILSVLSITAQDQFTYAMVSPNESDNLHNTTQEKDTNSAPAEFPGGTQELTKYLSDNIEYPSLARLNAIEGTVKVKFQILSDGSLAYFEIVQSPNALLNASALAALESMPKWTPAYVNGQAVQSSVVVPIRFGLE